MKRLPVSEEALARFSEKHHVRRLALFGSQLADMAGPDSDIDLLVEFEPGRESGLLGRGEMEAKLANLLEGRNVDLRARGGLSRHFRDEVLRNAEVANAR